MQAEVSTHVLSLKLLDPTRPAELTGMDLSSPGLLELPDESDGSSQTVDSPTCSLSKDDERGLESRPDSPLSNGTEDDLIQIKNSNFSDLGHSDNSKLVGQSQKDKSSFTMTCLENALENLSSFSNSCDLNGDPELKQLGEMGESCSVTKEESLVPENADVASTSSTNSLDDGVDKAVTSSCPFLESCADPDLDETKAASFMLDAQSCDELNFSHESNQISQEDLRIERLSLYNSKSRDDLPSNPLDDVVRDRGSSSQSTSDQIYRQLNASGEMSPSLASIVDSPLPPMPPGQKSYDYLLKFLLVGDSDVGKQEILADFEDGTTDSPFCSSSGAAFKTTTILIDGKRVKLQLWDTSGQGRFCTIIRSYSRGAQGILLVYDITNRWSFEGIDRWLKEVDQHAPGIPKVLVGNRLHFEFRRQVDQGEAEEYAQKNFMGFFEVSPLVNFNISESFTELARMALKRNGMERLWRSNKVSSLYEICAHAIVNRTAVYGIHKLPLPESVKQNLKSYAMTNFSGGRQTFMGAGGGGGMGSLSRTGTAFYKSQKHSRKQNKQPLTPADAAKVNCGSGINRKSCTIS